MNVRQHPYAAFVGEVNKPAQYLGGEQGEVQKDWDEVDCRICLAFPDLYEIGMSHLGFKILYGIINDDPRLVAERAYAVWDDMEEKLREHGEALRSLETWRPLSDFDIVGFSLQFELTFTNILSMLELGGVPRFSHERGEGSPLVVAGGPVATHAEAIAPFIDVFLIGDGEEKTPELMRTWAALRDAGVPRAERLEAIAQLGGFYVPSLYETETDPETGIDYVARSRAGAPLPVRRSFLPDLTAHPFPAVGPVAATETIFDRVSVEIARGCTEGCRFCQAGMIYRPVRERPPEEIIDTIGRAIEDGGYDEVSLTSLSTADYSAISPLVHETMKTLADKNVSLSVSSLRAYGLGADVLDEMKTQRLGGLTFAPEAGTQRMRDVVNKNVTEAQLLETAERVFTRGWARMKLYFMIGLPTEEDDDVRGIVRTGQRALDVARRVRGRKGAQVTVSVSSHVPKPHTPFQWCRMDSHDEIVRKQSILRDEARSARVKLKMHDSEGSWLEGVLARGDRRLAAVISDAYEGGARFDSWHERLKLDVWTEAFKRNGVETAPYLATLPTTATLPWNHIDVGLEDGFLAREYRRALKHRLSPPCGKAVGDFVHHSNLREAEPDHRKLVCYNCGIACDMTQMRETRLVSLRTLGAEEAPVLAEDSAAPAKSHEGPRLRPQKGAPARVRIGFTKLGRVAYTSHLDLVRIFPRLFRRLGLPLYYTEGYNPKPRMTFSPALSLGVASLGEYVDLKLEKERIAPEELESIGERLRAIAPEGVDFFEARVLGPHDPALNRLLDEAVYVCALPRPLLRERGFADDAAIEAHIMARYEAGGLSVLRPKKRSIGKRVGVSRVLLDVRVGEGSEELERASFLGDLLPVTLVVRLDSDGTAKASEAIAALLDDADLHPKIVRVGVYGHVEGERLDPLRLERFVRLPPAADDDASRVDASDATVGA